ncbi:MAG: hypothetical protein ABSD85_10985 [Acidimicrobiales bacterium]
MSDVPRREMLENLTMPLVPVEASPGSSLVSKGGRAGAHAARR